MKYQQFSKTKGPFGWGSNFYPLKNGVLIGGVRWNDTETYFQAMKFKNLKSLDYYNLFKVVDSPMKAKALGSQKKLSRFMAKLVLNKSRDQRKINDLIDQYKDVEIRKDWEILKYLVMIKALIAKFTQYRDLRKMLLDIPDDTVLVEYSKKDKFWGDNGTGTGFNVLGKILTGLRWLLKYGSCNDMPREIYEYINLKKYFNVQFSTKTPKKKSPTKTGVTFVDGNILTSGETWLVHQCNCVTNVGKGISKDIFDRFPYANIYKNRKSPSTPGTVIFRGDPNSGERMVANMLSQYFPGGPKKSPENDNRDDRLKWFSQCLGSISVEADKYPNLERSISIPFMIGCGLAKGKWSDYLELLKEFSDTYNFQVVIYKLPESK